jgi:polyvinyl alcohol dehydrogenase (cytochrome)
LSAAYRDDLQEKIEMRALKLAVYVATAFVASHASAQSTERDDAHPGRAVYERTCGACHNNPEATRAPALASLRMLNRSTVDYAITTGYMKLQAKDLKPEERAQLLEWLSLGQTDSSAWIARARCSGKAAIIDAAAKPIATTFGLGPHNLRQQSAAQAGLTTGDFAKLELAWSVGFPQTSTMRSQPVVVGDTVFVASTDAGRIFALSAQNGCLKWQYESAFPLRSSLSYGEMEIGKPVIVAGDAVGAVVAIDAKTGKQLWRADVKLHESNRVTGTPVIYKGRVFAPLSAVEINYTRDDNYECCTAHGAVIALERGANTRPL